MATQTNPVKPGWQTTEFWTTVATDVATAVTLIFHKDFSADVPAVAVAASAVAHGVYTFARTSHKKTMIEQLAKTGLADIVTQQVPPSGAS